ncbi:hypothetical protein Tco_0607945 [Tanacetum coccineum]
MESQSETTQIVSALKLPILKIGDYDLWSMRMDQYLTHTDYDLWEVIMNGDAPAVASTSAEAKSTLLLAIPDKHLLKFHGIKDAKTLWKAIKARFGGNKESKKMQKTILKQQYENFTASRSKGLDKTYDSRQSNVAKDKAGLGYDSQMNENEVVHSVFNSKESDVDDSSVNDRFKTAVVTKSGQVPVNTAKQSSPRAATSISTARPVNTAAPKPKVNDALPTTYSYFKAHSPVRRAFNQKSAAKTYNLNEKVKTARVNNVTTTGPKTVVSAVVGNGENAVKSSAC